MNHPRRPSALFTIMLLLLASCAKDEGRTTSAAPAARASLRVAVNPVPQSALVIIAAERGYFARENLDVTVSRFPTGKLAFDAVLGGAADVATVADVPIMYALMSGQAPAVLATIERSGKSVKLLARKDAAIASPADLRGKKVGTFKGSSGEFFLDALLAKHHVPSAEVAIVHLQPPDLVTAITRKDVAAISIFEPHIHNAATVLGSNALVVEDPSVYTEIFNVATTEKALAARQDAFVSFLRALQRAADDIRRDPNGAQASVARFTQLDPNVLREIWPMFQFTITTDRVLPDLLRREADFAVRSGSLPAPSSEPQFERVLKPEVLSKATATP